MTRPRLLDLCCKAGGAAKGYADAGFEVVGVDIEPQPNYPYEFIRDDALALLEHLLDGGTEHAYRLSDFDALHASPPCHRFSTATGRGRKERGVESYPDLITPIRPLLQDTGLPYVIENVVGAPLFGAFRLCGSSFGLDLQRHRLFEPGQWHPGLVPPCAHHWQRPRFRSLDGKRKNGYLARVVGVHGHVNYTGEAELRCAAMGIDWMTQDELTQAIPPAYTEFIGTQLLAHIESERVA